jgi:DNA replication protein DnaC
MLEDIHRHLELLKLPKMMEVIKHQLKEAQNRRPSYSSFLLNLLRQEYEDKRQRTIKNRIGQSGLPDLWTLDTYPFHLQRRVNKKQHFELAELDFMSRQENIVWIGPTGVGKTGLASSIILKALYKGHTARFIKAQDLFDAFGASVADRSTHRLLKRLSRLELLLIDEVGYVDPLPGAVNSFFRLIENRYNKKPTLITTNLGYQEWPKFLGRGPMASALLSRLLHNCHTIVINGVNLRTPKYRHSPGKERE